MAKTLLNGVNDLLKRVQIIAGDSGELSSLTDSGRQPFIDIAVQVWNEAVEQLYSVSDLPMPQEMDEATITLVTGDRDYALAADLVQLHFPLIHTANFVLTSEQGWYILEYPGGYMNLVDSQPFPASYTGLPTYAAIRPTDGQLYLDRIPTAAENNLTFTYRYDKDVSLSLAADTFPFSDAVYRALLPVAGELWRLFQENKSFEGVSRLSFGRAARFLTNVQQSPSWTPRISYSQPMDPFE